MTETSLPAWLAERVYDAMEPVPAMATADEAAVGLLARLVAAAGTENLAVVDEAGRALGLLSAADLLPHLATPVSAAQVMRAGDLADRRAILDGDQPLVEAVAHMRRAGREHALVVDTSGQPVGLLRLSTALAAGYGALLPSLEQAVGDGDEVLNGSAQAKAAQVPLAAAMLGDGRSAIEVQAVLGALNDRVVARVVADAVRAMVADGWGEAPVPFTMLQMGSAGRRESFLNPDQDHGFILHDYPDEHHGVVDPWYIALAERLTSDLERVGYPRCDGNVMAINPLWRKPLRQWLDQVVYWTRTRSNQALLQADIFFDFRPVYGPSETAAALRRHVTAVVRDERPFLAQMCWRQREQSSPLGLFGHLGQDPIDLKLWGTLPLVELTRIMALCHGIPESGTLARLDALLAGGALPHDLHEALTDGHQVLAGLRLHHQLAELDAGRSAGNLVEPRQLTARERQQLERLFQDIERLRRRVLSELLGTSA